MNNHFKIVKDELKNYLSSNSLYNPSVMTTPKGETFPKVVIQDISNIEIGSDFNRINTFSQITYEIDIYAKSAKKISERTIAKEIESHILYFMGNEMGFKRVYDRPTPNVDTSVYRITMRFQTTINDRTNKFI